MDQSSKDGDITLPKILGENQSFREKIKNWNIGNFGANEENPNSSADPGNVTITGSDNASEGMEVSETEAQKAQREADAILQEVEAIVNDDDEAKKSEEAPAKEDDTPAKGDAAKNDEPPEVTLTTDDDEDDEERLREKALGSIGKKSKKRGRENSQEATSVDQLVAKARSEAEAKRAMLEQQAMKSRRIMLYLPEKGANFKDIMTDFNCAIDKAYNDGVYKGQYRSLLMEREARWDRDNKMGQIYPAAGSDVQWFMKILNEILERVPVLSHLYLFRDFVAEWDIAILLLNGSALVSMGYDRERVLVYLERNLGEIAKLDRDAWRLISISQPRVIKRKLEEGAVYYDAEGKRLVCEKAGKYDALTGNALTTLHVRSSLAAKIKSKGNVIPFQHGPVKVKWGNPDIIFKQELGESANTTPLGPGPGAGKGLGASTSAEGTESANGESRPRKFVEKPQYQDPNKVHLGWAAGRREEKEEKLEDIVTEFIDYEAHWEQTGRTELEATISKFKYLLENPNDEDDISVKSYRTEAGGASAASTSGLTKGQKKNLAIKKKTLCEKAKRLRLKRITKLGEFKDRLVLCYCPIKKINDRDELLANIERDVTQLRSTIEGNGVVMEYE